MSKLGTALRDARIEKGYTLNTLQQMTKIQKKYLEAIEEGRFNEIPGNFYVRAFVKQFADVVGIDGDELLLTYQAELDAVEHGISQYEDEEPVAIIPSRLERSQTPTKQNFWDHYVQYLPMVALGIVFLFIMSFIVMAILNINKKDKQQVASSSATTIVASVEPNSATSSSAAQSSSEATKVVEGGVRVGNAQMKLISGEGEETTYELYSDMTQYQFTLVGKGYDWVGVYEDEEMTMDTTVNEGETLKLKIKPNTRSVRIRLGYAEGATIQVNNTEVKINNKFIPESIVFRLNKDVKEGTISNDESQTTDNNGSASMTNSETENTGENTTSGTNQNNQSNYQGPAVLDPNRRNR